MTTVLLTNIIFFFLAVCGAAASVVFLLHTWVELRAIRNLRLQSQKPSSLRRIRNPHITVLVYCDNNASTVLQSLESIYKQRYRKLRIILVNNHPQDTSTHGARLFKQLHPKADFIVFSKRKRTSLHLALHEGAKKRSQDSELLLSLSASHHLAPGMLKELATHYKLNRNAYTGEVLLSRLPLETNLLSYPYYIFSLMSDVYLRAVSIIQKSQRYSSQLGMIGTVEGFMAQMKTGYVQANYSSTTLYSTPPPHYLPSQTSYKIKIFATIYLLISGFSLYAAATMQSTTLLVSSWLVFSLVSLFTVWLCSNQSTTNQLKVSYSIPFVYFLLIPLCITTLFIFLRDIPSRVLSKIKSLKSRRIAFVK